MSTTDTPTPRTDEALDNYLPHLVPADFARGLERELAYANEAFRIQRENYIRLYEAVVGEGTFAGTPDPFETVKQLRPDLTRAREELALWIKARDYHMAEADKERARALDLQCRAEKAEAEVDRLQGAVARLKEELILETGLYNDAAHDRADLKARLETSEAALTQSLATSERFRDAAKDTINAWDNEELVWDDCVPAEAAGSFVSAINRMRAALAASPHAAPAAVHEDTKRLRDLLKSAKDLIASAKPNAFANGVTHPATGDIDQGEVIAGQIYSEICAAMTAAPLPPTKAGEAESWP